MKTILELIRNHQISLGKDASAMTEEQKIKYIRELTLGASIELSEMLQELPWKPWKNQALQLVNQKNALKELADVFIFLFDIWYILNPKHDMEGEILRKIRENQKRLTHGEHIKH